MGFEQDNIYPMIEPTPEIMKFGGFKYSESFFDIGNKSADCLNVYARDGALWQMLGSEKYESSTITGSPTVGGLFVYGQESSGTAYVLATTSNKVWRYNAGWTDVSGSLTLSGRHYGLTFNNIFIGVTSDRSAPYKISGTSSAALLGGSPPSGKVIGRIGEFIVIGNTSSFPSYAYYSNPGDPEAGWDKFWDVKSDDTQGLTAVGELDQRTGYLFKEFTADRIEHIGGISFQHDRGYLPVGVVAQGTLKKCTIFIDGKAVSVLIGLSNEGVYAFDSSRNPFKISDDIEFKFDRANTDKFNRNYWNQSVGVYDPTRHWYWLFAPGNSSTGQMDELWICDLRTFDWWPANPNASASIAMIKDSNGDPQVHVGGYDGYVRRFSTSIKNYDTVAINAYYVTSVLDFKKTVRVRQFIPYAAQTGNYNLDFKFRWNLSRATTATDELLLNRGGSVYGTGTYGSATYGSGRPVFKNLSALNYTGRYLQIEFGNPRVDETFNLFKFEIPARIIGGRVGEYR